MTTAVIPNNRGSKTKEQTRLIFAIAKRRGLDDDELRSVVEEVTEQRSIRALSRAQADAVVVRLGGAGRTEAPARRTVQHRRKRAGVMQIAQPAQLHLIADLASQRSWTSASLEKFCLRQCKSYPPRTTADANKVIEGLKAINRREGRWAS